MISVGERGRGVVTNSYISLGFVSKARRLGDRNSAAIFSRWILKYNVVPRCISIRLSHSLILLLHFLLYILFIPWNSIIRGTSYDDILS